jgi:diaminohydroxyphosphoribosylaminopyrimidine deaminase/5-amino-6-(5-phosphoribosylamino)uracil reductase
VRSAQDDLLIFCAVAPTPRQRTFEALGVRVERVDASEVVGDQFGAGPPGRVQSVRKSGVCLNSVMKRLGALEIVSAIMEAGGQLNASALSGGHVDKLTLFYAPVFLGPGAVPLLQEPITRSTLPFPPEVECIDQDVRVDAYLRDPWGES